MKNQRDSASKFQSQPGLKVILLISLVVVLIAAGLLLPRFMTRNLVQKPPATRDGWITATLSEVGMEKQPILDLLTLLAKQEKHLVQSIVVVKDGKLVFETYTSGDDITVADRQSFTRKDFDRDTPHCLASATKSVTSILFGIAYDQGKITDLDEKLFASFPEYAELSVDGKDGITLRQMLTMTSGIPWTETPDFNDPTNDLASMAFYSPDPIRFVLGKQLNSPPGEQWQYNSGTTNLLGEIVSRKTGASLQDFARDNLFTPLGITSYEWPGFPNSPKMAVASSLLYLRPRDMAKIGQLYLQWGLWNGVQVVSPQWVRKSTGISVALPIDDGPAFQNTGYGYQWWRGTFTNGNTDTIYAAGWGGQFIFIMPKINTVVVMTGSNYYAGNADSLDLVNRYILGSIYGGG